MRALLLYQWRRHRVVLLALVLGLALFEMLITRIAPTEAQANQLSAMIAFLPKPIADAMGLQGISTITTRGVISFGYIHPFTILLLSAWIVRVAAGGLAGELSAGTMDLLATRPVGRHTIYFSVAIAQFAGVAMLAGAVWAGTSLGLATRDLGAIRAAEFAETAVGLALLFGALGGIALVVAALHRSGGGAIGVTSGIIAVLLRWTICRAHGRRSRSSGRCRCLRTFSRT